MTGSKDGPQEDDMASTFEEILSRDGRLVYKARGNSMRPFIRGSRDLVVIVPPHGRLKKGETALFKRNGLYVLHRVIEAGESGYVFRGDHNYYEETGVKDGDVIGVLEAVVRGGRTVRTESPAAKAYARVWTALYPLRKAVHRLRHL